MPRRRGMTNGRPARHCLVLAVAIYLISFVGSACAGAQPPPAIESESASSISPTDATLEAQINPGDAVSGVYYQFQIATNLGEYVSEIICPPEPSSEPAHPCIGAHSSDALPIGFVEAGSGSSSISLDLNSAGLALKPGTSYQYRVLVAKAIQSEDTTEWESPAVVGAVHSFETPAQPPPATNPGPSATNSSAQLMIGPSSPLWAHRHHRHRRKHLRRELRRSNVDRAVLASS
jgi:hypothetical protein